MSKLIKTVYTKFLKGDRLSDFECAIGHDHFSTMATMLRSSGSEFALAAKEATRVANELNAMIVARRNARRMLPRAAPGLSLGDLLREQLADSEV